MAMIFRDDDISHKTDLTRFKQVHEMFAGKKAVHTIAIICKDLELNQPLIDYINECGDFEIAIHCWEHVDLTTLSHQEIGIHFFKAINCIYSNFKVIKKPITLFPPWNISNEKIERYAKDWCMVVSNEKISLSQYIKGIKADVVNFHHWSDEIKDLPKAIEIYESRNN